MFRRIKILNLPEALSEAGFKGYLTQNYSWNNSSLYHKNSIFKLKCLCVELLKNSDKKIDLIFDLLSFFSCTKYSSIKIHKIFITYYTQYHCLLHKKSNRISLIVNLTVYNSFSYTLEMGWLFHQKKNMWRFYVF